MSIIGVVSGGIVSHPWVSVILVFPWLKCLNGTQYRSFFCANYGYVILYPALFVYQTNLFSYHTFLSFFTKTNITASLPSYVYISTSSPSKISLCQHILQQ